MFILSIGVVAPTLHVGGLTRLLDLLRLLTALLHPMNIAAVPDRFPRLLACWAVRGRTSKAGCLKSAWLEQELEESLCP